MRYLFTDKPVRVGDICIAICTKDQAKMLKLDSFFPSEFNKWNQNESNRIGIKITKVEPKRCCGYLVHRDSKQKLVAYKTPIDKLIYVNINSKNVLGIIKGVV